MCFKHKCYSVGNEKDLFQLDKTLPDATRKIHDKDVDHFCRHIIGTDVSVLADANGMEQ